MQIKIFRRCEDFFIRLNSVLLLEHKNVLGTICLVYKSITYFKYNYSNNINFLLKINY